MTSTVNAGGEQRGVCVYVRERGEGCYGVKNNISLQALMSYVQPAVDPVLLSGVRTAIKVTFICQLNSTEVTYIKTSTA